MVQDNAVPIHEHGVRRPRLLPVLPGLERVGEQQCQVGVTVGQSEAAQQAITCGFRWSVQAVSAGAAWDNRASLTMGRAAPCRTGAGR